MTDIPVLQEERVPVKSRVWISIADSSTAILQSLVAASALTYYFVKLRGLDPKMAGVVWLLFGIWNAINDPLLGYISDRTRSKIGRRLPYIRFGAPLLALFFILFWIYLPGSDTNQTMLFLQMLVVFSSTIRSTHPSPRISISCPTRWLYRIKPDPRSIFGRSSSWSSQSLSLWHWSGLNPMLAMRLGSPPSGG